MIQRFLFYVSLFALLSCFITQRCLSEDLSRREFVSPEGKRYKLAAPVSLLEHDDLRDWGTARDGRPAKQWEIVDGVLHRKMKMADDEERSDIVSKKKYDNFVLDFSWTIEPNGNSGIKYKCHRFEVGGWLGCEYQIRGHSPQQKKHWNRYDVSALYDMLEPKNVSLNPPDQVNHGRIVMFGNKIEHFLNGQKTIDVTINSPEWKTAHEASKFNETLEFGAVPQGRIAVQDYGCEIWIHDMTIREIVADH